MSQARNHITVCICTYRRAALLTRLLDALDAQKTDGVFEYSIVVADNDADRSAEPLATDFARRSRIPIVYCCEPRQNIALARNAAVARAAGDFIAFIDDDEAPVEDWLSKMFEALQDPGVAGVLGPVRPRFEETPPRWVVQGGFCERREHPTGTRLDWDECRSGNVVFRQSIIAGSAEPFDPKFGNGGEDKEFFLKMTQAGHVFIWCNEAPAYEAVPASRLSRGFMLRRALLRGKNILKHSEGRWKCVMVSLFAAPIYLTILPVMLLRGHHWFMKYCIKFCDHAGRLLAVAGLNQVSERGL